MAAPLWARGVGWTPGVFWLEAQHGGSLAGSVEDLATKHLMNLSCCRHALSSSHSVHAFWSGAFHRSHRGYLLCQSPFRTTVLVDLVSWKIEELVG